MIDRLAPGLLATAGAALIVTAAVLSFTNAPAVPAAAGVVPSTTPAATDSSTKDPARSESADRRARSITTENEPVAPAVPPTSVALPHNRRARVITAGTDGQGRLEPPQQVKTIGWWPGGAALGSTQGTMVLVGHVDSAQQGIGLFAHLRTLRIGDTVTVTGTDHRSTGYRVVARRSYPRSHSLPGAVFRQDIAPRLALITCTGQFNRVTAHYSDTLVIYAAPANTQKG